MPNPAPVPSSRRRSSAFRLLAVLLASFTLGALPAVAGAQSILPDQPQTKEQLKQAQEAADAAANPSASDTSDNSITYGLLALGALVLGGAAWWIIRDSGDAVGDEARNAPKRPLDEEAVGRGAPRTMFNGEVEPGGKTGKRKRRDVGKRQRQARKANRPR